MRTVWNSADERQAVSMRNGGATDAAIAIALGRSEQAVQTRLVRLRARGTALMPMRQPWSEERILQVIAMLDDGETCRSIARTFGIVEETVRINVGLLKAEGRVPDPDDEDDLVLVPAGDPLLAALRAEHGGRVA